MSNEIVDQWKQQDRLQDERGQMEMKSNLYSELFKLNGYFIKCLDEQDEVEKILNDYGNNTSDNKIFLGVWAGNSEFNNLHLNNEDGKQLLLIMLKAIDKRKNEIRQLIGKAKKELKEYD